MRQLTIWDNTKNQSINWRHSSTLSHAKSFLAFLLLFLQSYETNSEMENLGGTLDYRVSNQQ